MLPYSKDRISPEKPLPFNSSSYPVHDRVNQKFNLGATRDLPSLLSLHVVSYFIYSLLAPKNPEIIYVLFKTIIVGTFL